MKIIKVLTVGFAGVFTVLILCGFTELHIMGSGGKCLEGNGKRAERNGQVGQFSELFIDGAFEVVIDGARKAGPFTISAESNLLEHIVMEVENDKLSITADRSICAKTPVKIMIDGKGIHTIFSNGTSDINFSAVGSKLLRVKLDGSGTITLSGKTTSLSAEILGASGLMAKELPAKSVTIKTEGSSSAHVFAEENLKARSSGSSEIVYSGSPNHISKQEYEVGEVVPFTSE